MTRPQLIWRWKNIDVFYSDKLDGGGANMASAFVDFIREYFGPTRHFEKVFEWCAGPGFIGFALLAEGICDSVCFADVNPVAIAAVQRTINKNGLHERVTAYVSDNLLSVPAHEQFDLVVGNPPNFGYVNPEHPMYNYWKGDLRPHDPGWKLHQRFYDQIADHLKPGAHVLIEEVEPYSKEVLLVCEKPAFDIRPQPPADLFIDMMRRGGLVHLEDRKFPTTFGDAIKSWIQVSKKPGEWIQVSQKPGECPEGDVPRN